MPSLRHTAEFCLNSPLKPPSFQIGQKRQAQKGKMNSCNRDMFLQTNGESYIQTSADKLYCCSMLQADLAHQPKKKSLVVRKRKTLSIL